MEKAKLYFGNISRQGITNIPVMELCSGDEVIGYISPFRGYFFQVSRTIGGSLDMGTSRLHRPMSSMFKDVCREEKIAIYQSMIYYAILRFLSNSYGKNYEVSSDIFMGDITERFATLSVDWVSTYCK